MTIKQTTVLCTAALIGCLALPSAVFASEVGPVCYCHNVTHSPETLCFATTNSGHESHIVSGMDTLGACETPPSVPEFGVIPGAIALLSSGGAFLFLKKRAINR